jgi:hypothetical protein
MNGVFIEESRFSVLGWRQRRIRGSGEECSTVVANASSVHVIFVLAELVATIPPLSGSENAAAPVEMTGQKDARAKNTGCNPC